MEKIGSININRFFIYTWLLLVFSLWPVLVISAQAGTTAATANDGTAVFGALTGKVEFKEAGGKSWAAAKSGMVIKPGTTIATSLRAKAVIKFGQSTLTVNQLTRMTLEELIEKQGTVNTGLFLRHGQVEAEVKGSEGLKHNFILRSAVSTAAVRGTHFIFTPRSLVVKEGLVHYLNSFGQKRSVAAGEKSKLVAFNLPQSGRENKEEDSNSVPFTSDTATGLNTEEPPKAKVRIDIQW